MFETKRTRKQELGFTLNSPIPEGANRMNYEFGRQIASGGNHRASCRAAAWITPSGFFHDCWTATTVDCPIDTSAALQLRIRCVDD